MSTLCNSVKVVSGKQVRRHTIAKEVTFRDLINLVRESTGIRNIEKLFYEDDEKDKIIIQSDEDVREALRVSTETKKILRVMCSEIDAMPIANVSERDCAREFELEQDPEKYKLKASTSVAMDNINCQDSEDMLQKRMYQMQLAQSKPTPIARKLGPAGGVSSVAFAVTMTADQTTATNSSWVQVKFDSVLFDAGGNFNTTMFRFEEGKQSGYYHFGVSLLVETGANVNQFLIRYTGSGSVDRRCYGTSNALTVLNGFQTLCVGEPVIQLLGLTASVQIEVFQLGATTNTTITGGVSGASVGTVFWGYQLA